MRGQLAEPGEFETPLTRPDPDEEAQRVQEAVALAGMMLAEGWLGSWGGNHKQEALKRAYQMLAEQRAFVQFMLTQK